MIESTAANSHSTALAVGPVASADTRTTRRVPSPSPVRRRSNTIRVIAPRNGSPGTHHVMARPSSSFRRYPMAVASPTIGGGIHDTRCRAEAFPPLSMRSWLYHPAPRPIWATHGHTVSTGASMETARVMTIRAAGPPSRYPSPGIASACSCGVDPHRIPRRTHRTPPVTTTTAASGPTRHVHGTIR